MKWFRYYSEALDDPKVQLLPDAIYRGWVNILSIVNETEPSRGPRSGYLPRGIQAIAYKLHRGTDEAQELLDSLVTAGLLEEKSGRYRAHNWHRRQPVSDDVAARVSATRKNRTRNVTSTAPETEESKRRNRGEIDQELDTEEEEDSATKIRRRLRGLKVSIRDQVVEEAIAESGLECVEHCIDEAERHNKLSWAYVDAVRLRHVNEGCPPPELLTRSERLAAARW